MASIFSLFGTNLISFVGPKIAKIFDFTQTATCKGALSTQITLSEFFDKEYFNDFEE